MGTKVLSPPKPNLTKAQNSAIRELKRDMDCIVLTADKGVLMVIMDRQDYITRPITYSVKTLIKLFSGTPLTLLKISL